MIKEIQEIYKIIEFLEDSGKEHWSALLHGFITYLEDRISDSDDSDDIDYSEDEGNAVDEGIPEVHIDSEGFHSLK